VPPVEKFQRWVDLLVALLRHKAGCTFEDLAREVPAYGNGRTEGDATPDSVKRTFERDKADLKNLGVPLETLGADGAEDTRYRVRSSDFYLPYLALATPRGRQEPAHVANWHYNSLRTLDFVPDELIAIAEAASRARQLGDPALTAEVESAMRKLAFDLPLDSVAGADEARLVPPRAAADPAILERLGEALLHGKRVRIVYHAIQTDADSERVVEPYGLFWANGHWYLAARDVEKAAIRNFRVSRIRVAERVDNRLATRDYAIRADFDLREHARTKQPWELGDGDAIQAVVELRRDTGAVMAAGHLGAPVDDAVNLRAFDVRRVDAFARWLLSFAGGAVPVSPPAVVDEYRRQLTATAARYA
jgi:predicted DNA-binding transcriptional regulator YafY